MNDLTRFRLVLKQFYIEIRDIAKGIVVKTSTIGLTFNQLLPPDAAEEGIELELSVKTIPVVDAVGGVTVPVLVVVVVHEPVTTVGVTFAGLTISSSLYWTNPIPFHGIKLSATCFHHPDCASSLVQIYPTWPEAYGFGSPSPS